MHKISVLGHFGFKRDCLDGQTIKTKIVTEELQRIFGKAETVPYDTYGAWPSSARCLSSYSA